MDAPRREESPDLTGIGEVNGCTGAALDVGGPEDAPAYLLTSGHCVGDEYLDPNEILEHQPLEVGFWVGQFYGAPPEESFPLPVAEVVYATMHLRDVAILRLALSVREARELGVHLLRPASSEPLPGDEITIVGHPNNGILLRSRCSQGERVYLAEDVFWFAASSNDCSGIEPGSSGSPVMDAAGEVFGVLSTRHGSEHPCSLDSPCEPHEAQPLANPPPPAAYASDVTGLARCFAEGSFDVTLDDCPLTKPSILGAESKTPRFNEPPAQGESLRWNVRVVDPHSSIYRYKAGDARRIRCDDEKGYGEPRSTVSQPLIDEVIPYEAGETTLFLLCVQGGTTPRSFTAPDRAAHFLAEVGEDGPEEHEP